MKAIVFFLLTINFAFTQDSINKYDNNFYMNLGHYSNHSNIIKLMNDNQFKKLKPFLEKKIDLNDDYGKQEFLNLEIFNKDKLKIYRIIESCNDCEIRYFLFYESPKRTMAIDGKTPMEILEILLKLFKKNKIELTEIDVNQLVKESFFYFSFNKHHKLDSSKPFWKELYKEKN